MNSTYDVAASWGRRGPVGALPPSLAPPSQLVRGNPSDVGWLGGVAAAASRGHAGGVKDGFECLFKCHIFGHFFYYGQIRYRIYYVNLQPCI